MLSFVKGSYFLKHTDQVILINFNLATGLQVEIPQGSTLEILNMTIFQSHLVWHDDGGDFKVLRPVLTAVDSAATKTFEALLAMI